MISLSFIEPPGCITPTAPASLANLIESGKGKKASEAATLLFGNVE